MKLILLICAVVALVGCGKKTEPKQQAEANATVTPKPEPPKEAAAPTIITNVVREVVTNIVTATPQPTPTPAPIKPQPTPPNIIPANAMNPKVEGKIRAVIGKPTGELTKADLEEVTRMDLSGNKLTDVPKGLEKLTQLKVLILDFNQLTDVPKGLEKLTQLKDLSLAANQLTDVKGLEKLTQLTHLYLGHNPTLTKAQIAQLKKALPKCRIISDPKK